MSGVFTVLFLIALGLTIWGLIAPHHFAKHAKNNNFTRKNAGFGFGFFALLFLILASATTPSTPTRSANLNATNASSQTQSTTTTKQETNNQTIPFTTQNQNDSSLPKSQTKIIQVGKNGEETLIYKVTYTDGLQTNTLLLSKKVITKPVNQIVEVGTYVAPTPAPTPVSSPSPSPVPSPSPSSSCYPLTNGGNCYEPGEYCRNSDHGASGLAGDGEAIVCADNNGWRWEPR